MNRIWTKNTKLGVYNTKELREKLGLNNGDFNKLMELEVYRYKRMIDLKYGKKLGGEYYAAKVAENPNVGRYGNTPTFPPDPFKTKGCIFNDESGVYLEKTWSRRNKHNQNPDGQNLPFDFTFDPDRKA